MTETPISLPETPTASDLLSEVLGRMHLAGVVMFRTEFREPWSLHTPDGAQMARMFGLRTAHILPFHIIARGGCAVSMGDAPPVWLEEGDVVLLPYGDAHLLSGREPARTVHVGTLLPPTPWHDIFVVSHGGVGDMTQLVCGFLQCDELLFHPILRHLPALIHVRPSTLQDDGWLANTIRHTAHEASRTTPGVRCMLPRLTELMFVEILRSHMQSLTPDDVGWFAALNDPLVGAALRLLHGNPLHGWDMNALARQVGASRSGLASRFKHFLGQPPMQYLGRWRLQLAAQAMSGSEQPLKRVADLAGYESEAAFSRAFKRHFGLAPADWRKRQALG
jgi:AraC-like DNA-binding protein